MEYLNLTVRGTVSQELAGSKMSDVRELAGKEVILRVKDQKGIHRPEKPLVKVVSLNDETKVTIIPVARINLCDSDKKKVLAALDQLHRNPGARFQVQ